MNESVVVLFDEPASAMDTEPVPVRAGRSAAIRRSERTIVRGT
jgi:hypothetical protein